MKEIKEMDSARLARGSAYLITQSVATTIIGTATLAFIARALTQVEMGVTVALTLILDMAQVLSDLGFSSGLTKYVAEYRGKEVDYTFMSFGAVLIKGFISGFAAVLCVLTAPWLSGFLLKSDEYVFLFQLLSIYLFTLCLSTTMNYLLLGVNRIREMAILNIIMVFVGKMSSVGFLMFGFGLVGLVVGWTLGGLAYAILGFLILMRNKYVRIHQIGEVVPYLKTLARFSWPLFLTNIALLFYNWFDRAFLFAFVSLSEVAVYSVAIKAFSVLSVVSIALSTTLFPYYSEKHGKDEQQRIMEGIHGSSRYIALLYTPLALGLTATAGSVMRVFAGPAYAGGDIVLAILCLFGGINGLAASFGGLLLVFNMTPTVLLINVASIAGSMMMSPVLLPLLGVVGMAIIRGVAMIVCLLLTIFAVRKRIPIKVDGEAIWKSWSAAFVMFGVVWFVERIHFSPYLLPLYIVVGTIVYFVALRCLRVVNENDVELIRNFFGKRATVIMNLVERFFV
jgi:Membrane protein involved in the export of O-antigen and teichoic acid